VFLISRIKQERERVGDACDRRHRRGSEDSPTARLRHGLGLRRRRAQPRREAQADREWLAAAILIDAMLFRMVLAPALMRLLGECAWWRPRRWARGRGPARP
jgi:hypothetical protein